MTQLQQWNQTFGIKGQLVFCHGEADLPIIKIDNQLGSALVALQGAHVLHYQPRGEDPVLWMSPNAIFDAGKPLRGGIPICWPWFGSHTSDDALPAHGFARTSIWQPVSSATCKDGATEISFELADVDMHVRYTISVGDQLTLTLTTYNTGKQTKPLSQALHSYFKVSDIHQIRVEGLNDCHYIDKVDGGKRKQQQGDVSIDQEVDRIYSNLHQSCIIRDPGLNRCISIIGSGSKSTVIWNPWRVKSESMADMGKDGYLHMVCVETANAGDNTLSIAAGESHEISARYRVQPNSIMGE
ncbi:MAG: D-hexose-6-phosphate mutarotase [Mariprofundaceae bacterium]